MSSKLRVMETLETGSGDTDLNVISYISKHLQIMFSNLLMTGLVMVAILTRTGRAIPGTGVTGLYVIIHGK